MISINKIKISLSEKRKLSQILDDGKIEYKYSPLVKDDVVYYLGGKVEKNYRLTDGNKQNILSFLRTDKNIDTDSSFYNKGFNYSYKPLSVVSVIKNKKYDFEIPYKYEEGIPSAEYNEFISTYVNNTKIPPIKLEKRGKFYYIIDGHNRVIGSIIKGATEIEADIIKTNNKNNNNNNSVLSSTLSSSNKSDPTRKRTMYKKRSNSGSKSRSKSGSGSSGSGSSGRPRTKKAKRK